MSAELTMAAWALVLAVIQILATAGARTAQYGIAWNAGARDEAQPPLKPLPARLARAQDNLFETLPLFLGFVLIAAVSGRESALAAMGAQIYLVARVIYVPVYALGVPFVRSLIWVVSMVGIGMIGWSVLGPGLGV
jgi:uncharacterized MAPEG superfamily protein